MADAAVRIVQTPGVLGGKPAIRGTRISVELVLGLLAGGWNETDLLESYPHIKREDIAACLRYAHDLVASRHVSPAA